ncbi:menaquinone biosynthetic enzyme MqnA/MqnD family protein [Alteribacter natronophilus]|uniref:menaquinone biosynthetic enzyme MqnA/MqnD family protein n=1 Tax=Alteribacter natronophilus TaxID=2583810 RepID=UPI00110DFADA|nr:menaquinone biosynthesis protein [Alteribacter natronophilus]TMW73599.1 menaquinone biosynthesis protein [Alteribacter natronophilus]
MGIVVGEISYTNIMPLFYYLDRRQLVERGCTFVPKVPSELNRGMAEGSVDIGGISSFAYAQNAGAFQLLPSLSVSSSGDVGSIFLFSKIPINKLEGKRVALTSSSATSVNLLKIILGRFYGLGVDYVTMKPDFDAMMAENDACLLIGDDAIRTYWNQPSEIYRYDLGRLWNDNTRLPMTYAVVAARKNTISAHGELLYDLYDQMLKSKKRSYENRFDDLIRSIEYEIGGSRGFWQSYFKGLNHDLSPAHEEGLLLFYEYAYDLGLLEKPVKHLPLWQEAAGRQSV